MLIVDRLFLIVSRGSCRKLLAGDEERAVELLTRAQDWDGSSTYKCALQRAKALQQAKALQRAKARDGPPACTTMPVRSSCILQGHFAPRCLFQRFSIGCCGHRCI
jgi:hypothetical protein